MKSRNQIIEKIKSYLVISADQDSEEMAQRYIDKAEVLAWSIDMTRDQFEELWEGVTV